LLSDRILVASLPNTTAGMIEMDIGIIAASLVVMRPVLQLVTYKLRGKQVTIEGLPGSKGQSEHRNTVDFSSRDAKLHDRLRSITKTVELEMQSRSVSTESILRHGQPV
jgi:hypothetical protein